MYDIEKMSVIIKKIEKGFSDLNSFNLTKENINNTEKFYASSMAIFGILNEVINLTEEIIKKNDWGMPRYQADFFDILLKHGVVSESLSKELKKLVRDRNIIAHYYADISDYDLLNIQKRASFAKDFVARVKEIIRRENKSAKEQNESV